MTETGMTPEEAVQLEAAKKLMLRKILAKEAIERLGRVRLASPMLAIQIENYLLQLYQAGQLKEVVTDAKLRQILDVLSEKKRTSIRRR